MLREDASLAAFYLLSLALGVTIVSMGGSNVDLLHFLFGSVLALGDDALLLLGGVATLTLGWLAVAYRPLVIECVDPLFLRLSGRASALTHLSFLAIAVLNLVAAFQALGTLLAVGLMILPAVAARFWARDLAPLIAASIAIALASSVAGPARSPTMPACRPARPSSCRPAAPTFSRSCSDRGGALARRLRRRRHLQGVATSCIVIVRSPHCRSCAAAPPLAGAAPAAGPVGAGREARRRRELLDPGRFRAAVGGDRVESRPSSGRTPMRMASSRPPADAATPGGGAG